MRKGEVGKEMRKGKRGGKEKEERCERWERK